MNPLQSADYTERNFRHKKVQKEQNKAGQNSFVPLVLFCGFIFRLCNLRNLRYELRSQVVSLRFVNNLATNHRHHAFRFQNIHLRNLHDVG